MKNAARWMVCLAIGYGCVEQPAAQSGPRGVSQQELEAVRRRVATRAQPTPQHPLAINFDNKVALIGYDLNATEVRPGQSVTITFFWRCNAPVGDGWRLFTHLDDSNGPRNNQDNVGDVRRAYQPERWRPGEFIRDTQTFDLPADWDSPVVKIHVGLWKGEQRMAITPADQTDGQNRARAVVLPTGVQVQVSELSVPRTQGAITIDGRLDEPAWSSAARTGPLVNTGSGGAASPTDAHGSARLLWDENNLYVAFEVADDNLIDPSSARDNHLWEHDAVEIMIDPDGDGANYYEFQVSPKNQHFETRYDRARDPQPFGHLDFNPEFRSAVVTNGTIGNADDTDQGYTVEIAIPWTQINQGAPHTPPQAGDAWRVNLFLMDEPKTGGQRVAGWSAPRRGDFHTLERFGRITLLAEGGAAAGPIPSSEPAVVPTPPTLPTAPAIIPPPNLHVVRPPVRRPAPTR